MLGRDCFDCLFLSYGFPNSYSSLNCPSCFIFYRISSIFLVTAGFLYIWFHKKFFSIISIYQHDLSKWEGDACAGSISWKCKAEYNF